MTKNHKPPGTVHYNVHFKNGSSLEDGSLNVRFTAYDERTFSINSLDMSIVEVCARWTRTLPPGRGLESRYAAGANPTDLIRREQNSCLSEVFSLWRTDASGRTTHHEPH